MRCPERLCLLEDPSCASGLHVYNDSDPASPKSAYGLSLGCEGHQDAQGIRPFEVVYKGSRSDGLPEVLTAAHILMPRPGQSQGTGH